MVVSLLGIGVKGLMRLRNHNKLRLKNNIGKEVPFSKKASKINIRTWSLTKSLIDWRGLSLTQKLAGI